MKYLNDDIGMRDADSGDEAGVSMQHLEQELAKAQQQLIELPAGYQPTEKAEIQNRIGEILIDLNRKEDAYDIAREAFDTFVAAEQWEPSSLTTIEHHAYQMYIGPSPPEIPGSVDQSVYFCHKALSA